MNSKDEKILYAKSFEGVTSVTEVNDNNLIVATSKPEQFSKYYSEPIITVKTTFDGEMYNINICDERLLYSSLLAWRNLDLTSLFQRDHEIIYDQTYGKMDFAERENYLYTLKVAKELLNKKTYYVGELYDVINKMINYDEFKRFSTKGENKLSEDFFRDNYIPLVSKTSSITGYPKDIEEFNKGRIIYNPQKMLRKYYKKK